ncbi:MAG: TIGR04283 family arsenosugar biosynthesis glycosyltransferase [Calditrichia bacterium]
MKPEISIIIPTLNESQTIGDLVNYLHHLDSTTEIIVVDGNSQDDTFSRIPAIAKKIRAPRGRALQMNAGAARACGNVLWFLHADCRPHPYSLPAIKKVLGNSSVVGGAFEYRHDCSTLLYRVSDYLSNRKNQLFELIYGDMGIFVRRTTFEKIGRFAEIPIMEDMDFCQRLKREGKIVILPWCMMTSSRRWIKEGPLKNILRNWLLQIGWKMGFHPATLARYYSY